MQIENSFAVHATPDQVYAFLLDVNRVAGCVPGAELSEVVDPDTFHGKVKIKVGPITVAYSGTARITSRDAGSRRAELQAEGRETTGPGSARATAVMAVEPGEDGSSTVRLTTDFTVAGRVAQFGRGVMEDVSRRIVAQMAECIKDNLEGLPLPAATEGEPGAWHGEGVPAMVPAGGTAAAVATAKPVNALTLFFQVLWDRIRRLFGRR